MTKTSAPSTLRLVASADVLPQKWVGKIFERLAGQLGNKMLDLFAGVKPELVQAEWAQGLAGFSGDEIAAGLNACQSRKFAPNLGEFLLLCRPCLDGEIAWHEAEAGLRARRSGLIGQWSHPAVYRAAQVMQEALRHSNFKGSRNRWEHVLRTEFAKGWGAEVAAPASEIAYQPTLTPMPAGMRAMLAAHGLTLGRTAQSV